MTKCESSRGVSTTSGGIFDIAGKQKKHLSLREKTTAPDFWSDNESAQRILRDIKSLEQAIEPWQRANDSAEEILGFYEMAREENDRGTLEELTTEAHDLDRRVNHLEFVRKLGGEDDDAPAVLAIHSGAGGTESCDWCEMLYRMYCRWMENKGFTSTVLDSLPGDEAGLKSVTMEIHGEYAFGHLRAEIGVHRLVRISPFDSNARRHTSFASVYAYPVIEGVDDFEINKDEIRVDTYRASGAGGQHVNKTDSAVRMTHTPTGIVVQCQNERSQMKNRSTALRLLKARVRRHQKEEEEKLRQAKMADKKKIEWGSQIRSYVLHPYNMVKDHRTDTETSNTQAVLNGDIDMFIESYLLMFQ